MKLIVGLGNPGTSYRGTRHNVGFEVVDEVARRSDLAFRSGPAEAAVASFRSVSGGRESVVLVKPLTYMNRSGIAVGALQRYYRIRLVDLLVITEDVNLDLGRIRARRKGSAGGHNGLRSVIDEVATEGFSRIRIGVGRGDPERGLAGRVLSRFTESERPVIDEAVGRAADAAVLFVDSGIDEVMNVFNQWETEELES